MISKRNSGNKSHFGFFIDSALLHLADKDLTVSILSKRQLDYNNIHYFIE